MRCAWKTRARRARWCVPKCHKRCWTTLRHLWVRTRWVTTACAPECGRGRRAKVTNCQSSARRRTIAARKTCPPRTGICSSSLLTLATGKWATLAESEILTPVSEFVQINKNSKNDLDWTYWILRTHSVFLANIFLKGVQSLWFRSQYMRRFPMSGRRHPIRSGVGHISRDVCPVSMP